jgi:hypothetical protein
MAEAQLDLAADLLLESNDIAMLSAAERIWRGRKK